MPRNLIENPIKTQHIRKATVKVRSAATATGPELIASSTGKAPRKHKRSGRSILQFHMQKGLKLTKDRDSLVLRG